MCSTPCVSIYNLPLCIVRAPVRAFAAPATRSVTAADYSPPDPKLSRGIRAIVQPV
jgi:hypothetical protein